MTELPTRAELNKVADDMILDAVAETPLTFGSLVCIAQVKFGNDIIGSRSSAVPRGVISVEVDQLIDARLQALRKLGRIRFERRGRNVLWTIAD